MTGPASGSGGAGTNPGPGPNPTQTPVMTTTVVVQPLPLAGSKQAPLFEGEDVTDYINQIEILGKNAGLAKTEWPRLLKHYATESVRRTLVAQKALDGTDWDDAKRVLLSFYSASEEQWRTTPEDLREYVALVHKERRVRSLKSLAKYYQKFSLKCGTMVADGELTATECNRLFLEGFSSDLRKDLRPAFQPILAARGEVYSKHTPPTIDETLVAARAHFNRDNMDYSSGSDGDTEGSNSDSDSEDDCRGRTTAASSSSRRRNKDYPPKRSRARSPLRSRSKRERKDNRRDDDTLEDTLKRHMEQLLIDNMAKVTDRVTAMLGGQNAPPPQSIPHQQQPPLPQVYGAYPAATYGPGYGTPRVGGYGAGSRSCFGCGKTEGVDLQHLLGLHRCPDMQSLVHEGILRLGPGGQLVRTDGLPVPRAPPPGLGGMAQLIRDELQGRPPTGMMPPGRDRPPHMGPTSASVAAAGLFFEGQRFPAANVTNAFPHYRVDAVTRAKARMQATGRDADSDAEVPSSNKRVRFEDDDHVRQPSLSDTEGGRVPAWTKQFGLPSFRPTEEPPVAPQGKQAPMAPNVAPSTAPHPGNLRAGWEGARRDKPADARPAASSKPYRFTSQLQDAVSFDSVQDNILNSRVTVTLRELLGASPELQKRMQGLVKTRREFNVQTNDGCVCNADDEDGPSVALSWNEEAENLEDVLRVYADAVSLSNDRHFAIVGGLVSGFFGDQRVTFLVDTGSELNIIGEHILRKCANPPTLDKDGGRWSLRGIGGEDVPLVGCCRDAPVQIDGKNFDHHFFVSPRRGAVYDGILGQPWLSWYSCDIGYQRAGEVYLRAYVSGDKTAAFASVKIVNPTDHRNRTQLVHAATGEQAF